MRIPPEGSWIPSSRPGTSWVILALILLSGAALGAEPQPSRVALVESRSPDALLAEATMRVRAELAAAGFDVELLEASPGADPRAEVESAGLDPPPVATLAILRTSSAAAVDIWVADRLTGKTLVRRIDVNDVSRERAPTVLAVRTVELLRASLLEATTAGEPETPEKAPTPRPVPTDVARWMTPPSMPPKDRAVVRAEIGAGLLIGFSGSPPAFAPVLRVGYGSESLSVRISIVAPAVGAEVAAPDGSATLRQALGLVEITTAWPRRGPGAIRGSLGAGAAETHVVGSAEAPYVAHHGDDWSFAGDAGLGGMLRFGPSVALVADMHAVVLAKSLDVELGDAAEHARRPMELATLGLRGSF